MTSYKHSLESELRERENMRKLEQVRESNASCQLSRIEFKIVNDNHGVCRAQNDHNFRDISRKHDTCLDNLKEQMLVSYYFCRAFF